MEAVSNINLQIRPARPHEEMFVDEASLGAQDGSEGNTYWSLCWLSGAHSLYLTERNNNRSSE